MKYLRGLPTLERLNLQTSPDPLTGCWNWTGSKDKDGYGYIKYQGKTAKAHRVRYLEVHGKIPDDLWILHKCHNPSCNNPEHLYAGTALQNSKDKQRAGRGYGSKRPHNTGVTNPNAKLSTSDIEEILTTYSRGMGPALGNKFGVRSEHITRIVRNARMEVVLEPTIARYRDVF